MAKQGKADREAAKQRLAEERARQAAADRRRRNVLVAVTVVIVTAIAIAVGFAISADQRDRDSAVGPAPAAAAGANGGIATGPSEAKAEADGIPTVDVYADFQCPACKGFEAESGKTLEALAADGKARVIYHPINLIGAGMSADLPHTSSLRGASAFACATEEDLDDGLEFQRIAYANQPEEGVGITDDQLVAWGTAAGIMTDSFAQCVRDQTFVGWAERVDAESGDRGITSTPTVLVDGEELTRSPNQYTPEGITAAVAAAMKG